MSGFSGLWTDENNLSRTNSVRILKVLKQDTSKRKKKKRKEKKKKKKKRKKEMKIVRNETRSGYHNNRIVLINTWGLCSITDTLYTFWKNPLVFDRRTRI